MNCLFLVLLLLCCGNNGNGFDNGCGCDGGIGRRGEERRERYNSDGGRRDGNGGRCERSGNDDCGCRNDFRPEPRFEQRPFMFNQNSDCGCDNSPNND